MLVILDFVIGVYVIIYNSILINILVLNIKYCSIVLFW